VRRSAEPSAQRQSVTHGKAEAKRQASSRQESADRVDTQNKTNEVSEIGIEHSIDVGDVDCTFIAKSDGTLRYEGRSGVERIGEFTGKIPSASFDSVADLIERSNYMGLKDSYISSGSGMGPRRLTFTTVVMNGKRHVVMKQIRTDCPKELTEIEVALDRLLEQAEWDEKEATRRRRMRPHDQRRQRPRTRSPRNLRCETEA
jgi:hypothetical protein